MDVHLFVYSKKHNSTALPTVPITPTVTAKLKNPTSILKPVLELRSDVLGTYATLCRSNYAYLPDFQRYYFITNWTLDGVLAIASLEVDVLGSYKTDIEGSYQYVLRSASNYTGYLSDAKYPILAARDTVQNTTIANPFHATGDNLGTYIVAILSKTAALSGATYYAMSALVFMSFCQQMFTLSNIWGSDTTVATGIKKSITDPFQYVMSVHWLPYATVLFSNADVGYGTATQSIDVGYDTITIASDAYRLADIIDLSFSHVTAINVHSHPQVSARGAFLNCAPYTRHYLTFYPFCGNVELNSAIVSSLSTFYLVYSVDIRTGRGILSVCTSYTGTDTKTWQPVNPFEVMEAQVGVSIPVTNIKTALPASLGSTVRNAVTSTTEHFGGFTETLKRAYASLGAAVGAAGEALGFDMSSEMSSFYESLGAEPISSQDVSEIAQNTAAMTSSAEIRGSQGTFSLFGCCPIQYSTHSFEVADDALAINGRPLCQYRQLGGATPLTGFVCCDNPTLTAPTGALVAEVKAIENYMASGFYM